MWHHIQHKMPSASANKFAETLGEISKPSGRVGQVNVHLFKKAKQEWEFLNHTIDVKIKMQDKMYCPPCGKRPIMGSSDGIVKLMRLKSAGAVRKSKNERPELQTEKPFYGDAAIKSDEAVKARRDLIYSKIPRTKQKEMCGGSVFKAARIDSGKDHKSDETGLIVSGCRHGMVKGAINMHHGETFTHTHFIHHVSWKQNCQFFCNDVVCKYWKFAIRVGKVFPQFMPMVNEMGGFLPRMHAKAHYLTCQVLWNVHWKKRTALTIGEEHEQVFSRMSQFGYVTKHMTKTNRENFLSAEFFYWNKRKLFRMPKFLRNRLLKVRILFYAVFKT